MGNDFSKPTSKDVNAGVSKDFNADIFSLVWLDAKVHTSAENISAQGKLKEVINQIKTFEDITLCEQYIRSLSEDNRIIVMSSGSLGKEIVQRIHPLRQVFSIYIFCFRKETHEQWAEPYVKVNFISILILILIY
jgi:hypothetical protein